MATVSEKRPITLHIISHVANNDHLLRGWLFITCLCAWEAGGSNFAGGSFSDKGVLPGRSF